MGGSGLVKLRRAGPGLVIALSATRTTVPTVPAVAAISTGPTVTICYADALLCALIFGSRGWARAAWGGTVLCFGFRRGVCVSGLLGRLALVCVEAV